MFFNNTDEEIIKRFLKKEEKHLANAISFYELFLLCKDRFILIEDELYDLKKIFSHHFDINNLVFKEDLDGNIALVIDFFDDKKEFIVINSDMQDEFNIALDTTNGKYDKLINYAKAAINKAFKKEDIASIYRTFDTISSSNTFKIKGLSNELSLTLNNKNYNNYFKLNYLFDKDYVDESQMLKRFDCKTNLYDIKDKISDLKVLREFLNNIKINEENVPKFLLKK